MPRISASILLAGGSRSDSGSARRTASTALAAQHTASGQVHPDLCRLTSSAAHTARSPSVIFTSLCNGLFLSALNLSTPRRDCPSLDQRACSALAARGLRLMAEVLARMRVDLGVADDPDVAHTVPVARG